MFRDFLRQYIEDLIECSFDEYKLRESDKDRIADNIERDEHIWSILDEAVFNELEPYRVEYGDDPADVVGFDKQTELEKRYE